MTEPNVHEAAMAKALERKPPIIVWQKKPNGVQIAVYVYDPHSDGGHNAEKTACWRGHPFDTTNTLITRTGRQCRACKNLNRRAPARETSLLAAARTEL